MNHYIPVAVIIIINTLLSYRTRTRAHARAQSGNVWKVHEIAEQTKKSKFYLVEFLRTNIKMVLGQRKNIHMLKCIYVSCHQQKYEKHISIGSVKMEFKACKCEKSRNFISFLPKVGHFRFKKSPKFGK